MSHDSSKRERFGRYLILDHLIDGGMAKISRARFLGEQAAKVVAIKMVQQVHSKDESYKIMFMDEIKVTFGLSHPNIIQTYDYGIHAGQLFVAMEYCDGRNLKEFTDKLKERKFVFPVEISIYIISQVCQGLYYAHTFRDKLTGVNSSIIHRDISPHNIMMSYDGAIKIIDFGIAKSKTNTETTQAGTIKGKLSYLAPEYLEGLELDPRYDQFAVGITLWEMLCNRKLFKENNDLAVLKKIQECKIAPPSSINPNVPKELDEIVLKALSKDRTKRYENLDQMNRALMKILYARFPDFNSTDLSFFSKELFRDEIKKDREKLFEFGKINIKPYLDDLKNELEGGTNNASGNDVSLIVPETRTNDDVKKPREAVAVKTFDFELDGVASLTIPGNNKTEDKKLSILKLNEYEKGKAEIPATKTKIEKRITSKTVTGIKRVEITDKKIEVKEVKSQRPFKIAVASVAIVLLAGAYYQGYFQKKLDGGNVTQIAPVNKHLKKGPTPASVQNEDNVSNGTIILTHFDKRKMQVFIDGKKEETDAISGVKVPLRKDFILRVQIEGKKYFIKTLRVDNSAAFEVEIQDMPNAIYGYLNTSTGCSEGEIKFEIFDEPRSSVIPMKQSFGIALPMAIGETGKPIPQVYKIQFTKTGETESRIIEITISREDQTIDLCEFL